MEGAKGGGGGTGWAPAEVGRILKAWAVPQHWREYLAA